MSMTSIKLPLSLRLVLIAGVAILAAGAGLFGYRYYTRPVTLTVAVGSIDGEAAKAMSAIAGELVSTTRRCGSTVIDTGTALAAAKTLSPRARLISPSFAAMSAICRKRKPSSSSAIWSY